MRIALGIVAAVAVGFVMPGAAQAGGAGFLPPIELEVGQASVESPTGPAKVVEQVLIGISWASMYPGRTPVDVSVGYVNVGTGEKPGLGSTARMPEGVEVVEEEERRLHGGFLAVEARALEGRHWRMWAGGRAEILEDEGTGVLGGFGRVSAELWMPTVGGDRSGAIFGTLALTAWTEVGMRGRPDGTRASVVAAGLGMRIPFVAAAW